ncbi:MAG TPA: hypothetical protein VM658_05205 [bacterium]|nr:hypothetical protein [bacterium]
MDRSKPLMVLMGLLALALLGPGPCEAPKLDDSIEPVNSYLGQFVGNGAAFLQIYDSPAHYFGLALDPASIDNTTVMLQRASDGAAVNGLPEGFEASCVEGTTVGCYLGIDFRPGGLTPCALDGDTTYELIIDGVLLMDGSSLPAVTFTFRTAPVPAGHTPNFCSEGVTWWSITDVHATLGLNDGIAGTINVYLWGVEDRDPWNNYDAIEDTFFIFCSWEVAGSYNVPPNFLNNPPYIPVLKILNFTAGDYDLAASAGWIQIVDSLDNAMDVKLPGIVIPPWETLLLYVADNGSSFYMYDDGVGGHTLDLTLFPECGFAGLDCPTMDPPTAFAEPPAATW